jgi:hypothetical protein
MMCRPPKRFARQNILSQKQKLRRFGHTKMANGKTAKMNMAAQTA